MWAHERLSQIGGREYTHVYWNAEWFSLDGKSPAQLWGQDPNRVIRWIAQLG
jgi:hypothetical protein